MLINILILPSEHKVTEILTFCFMPEKMAFLCKNKNKSVF